MKKAALVVSFLSILLAIYCAIVYGSSNGATVNNYGKTRRTGGAGCAGCHGSTAVTTTISGPRGLAAGATATYTITVQSAGSGRVGIDIASSDVNALSVADATYTQLIASVGTPPSAEITHNGGSGNFKSVANSSASFTFNFTMPAAAAPQSQHTIYSVAAAGFAGGWAFPAQDFVVYVPPPPPTSASVGTINSTSVVLNWSGGGPEYTAVYKSGSTAPTSTADGTPFFTGTATTATATGLTPSTQYAFSVFSKITGQSVYSTTGATATATTAPPSDPNPYVDSVNGNDSNFGDSTRPLKTIKKALTQVGAGGTIYVRPGTYNTTSGETFPITVPSGIKLQSTAGATTTILDATGANKRVLNCSGNSNTTLVGGFTITGGLDQPPNDGTFANATGGGILANNSDQTTISRCIITGNQARGYDGNSTYTAGGYAYGGGVWISGSQTKLVNCVISNNVARGGNGFGTGAGTDAHAGGVSAGGTPTITNCTFYNNTAQGGNGNTPGKGFYPGLDGGSGTVVNNSIFASNVAVGGTGSSGSGATFTGVIAGSGSNNLFFNDSVASGTFTASITGQDPLFISTTDLHLRSSSPARRAGTSTGAPTVDLDGNPRTSPPTIGAYEIGLFLTATGGIGRITVTWPGVVGSTSYNLYMSQTAGVTTSNFQRKVTGATTPVILSPLANGTTEYFIITAIENSVEGPSSPEVSATAANGTWALSRSGTFTNVTRDLASGTTLYAAANDSVGVYKSTDAGDNWTALSGIINSRDIRAVAANGSTVIAVTRIGDILRSADGGSTWSVVLDAQSSETVKSVAIDPLTTNTIYAGDFEHPNFANNMMAKSVDGGLTFNYLPSGGISAYNILVDPVTAGTVWTAGTGTPNLSKSTDGGNTWSPQASFSPAGGLVYAFALAASQPQTLYAEVDNGTAPGVYKTTNGGTNWTKMNTGMPATIPQFAALFVDLTDPNRVHAGTYSGYYTTTNGGTNWALGPSGGPYPSSTQYFTAFAQTSSRRLIGTTSSGVFVLALDPPPTIGSINPNSGPSTGSTSVTLTGTGFRSGASVSFDGIAATNVNVVNATTITATTPSHVAAAVNVAVSNNDGQSSILSNGFTYSNVSCSYSISPTSATFSSNAATGTVTVTTTTSCPWTAVSNATFITITSGAAGSGSGTVAYSVAANTTGASRNGTLTIAGITFTVTQTGPLPHGDANGDGQVTVADVFYLINSLFAGGPQPVGSGDVNGDGQVTVADIFYLINYLYAGGPAPR